MKKGGGTNACICMGTHCQPSLQNRLMDVTKLGRDEVLMARHMHKDVLAISAQGQIQVKCSWSLTSGVVFRLEANPGRGKIGQGGPLLQKTSSSYQKATAINRIHTCSNDLEACVIKCCCFSFHFIVKFLTLESSL